MLPLLLISFVLFFCFLHATIQRTVAGGSGAHCRPSAVPSPQTAPSRHTAPSAAFKLTSTSTVLPTIVRRPCVCSTSLRQLLPISAFCHSACFLLYDACVVVVVGMDSASMRPLNDRMYVLACQHMPDTTFGNCQAHVTNWYDHPIDFTVPAGHVLTGLCQMRGAGAKGVGQVLRCQCHCQRSGNGAIPDAAWQGSIRSFDGGTAIVSSPWSPVR